MNIESPLVMSHKVNLIFLWFRIHCVDFLFFSSLCFSFLVGSLFIVQMLNAFWFCAIYSITRSQISIVKLTARLNVKFDRNVSISLFIEINVKCSSNSFSLFCIRICLLCNVADSFESFYCLDYLPVSTQRDCRTLLHHRKLFSVPRGNEISNKNKNQKT